MESFDRAANIALLQIKEAEDTAHIRDSFQEIIVQNAPLLTPLLKEHGQKDKIDTALRYRRTDPSTLFRGLIIQTNGAFEGFIRSLCASIIEVHTREAGSFAAMPQAFRADHIVNSAQVLQYLKTGTVRGIKYDFASLQTSLAYCLIDHEKYFVQPDVFTILMGNCTASKIQSLFRSLFIPGPFDNDLCDDPELRKWAGTGLSKPRMLDLIKNTLDGAIDLRNDIAHGNISRSLVRQEFFDHASFFKTLIPAIAWRASSGLNSIYTGRSGR